MDYYGPALQYIYNKNNDLFYGFDKVSENASKEFNFNELNYYINSKIDFTGVFKAINDKTYYDIMYIMDKRAELDLKIKTGEIDKYQGIELFFIKIAG